MVLEVDDVIQPSDDREFGKQILSCGARQGSLTMAHEILSTCTYAGRDDGHFVGIGIVIFTDNIAFGGITTL